MLSKKGLSRVMIVAFVIALFASQSLAAWGRSGKGRADRPELAALLAKKLDLTQDQIEQIKAGEQEQQKLMAAGGQKIKELGERLKDELAKDSPDKNKVHDLIRQIGTQMTELRIARTDSLLKLKALLTPEQREKFKELLDKKGGRMPLGLGGNRH